MSHYAAIATRKQSLWNSSSFGRFCALSPQNTSLSKLLMLVDVLLPLAIADVYTYSVPEGMHPVPGMRVLVPLARKEVMGIVYRERTEPVGDGVKLRDILDLPDAEPMVTGLQLQLWQWMADYYMCTKGEVMAAALPAKALDRQYIFAESKRRVRLPQYTVEEAIHPLSSAQSVALDNIRKQFETHDVVLLHGVTSSGKTEVYMHLIDETLSRGKQVLYLVPEIALTTQLTDRLSRTFGDKLYVYHSRITDAQRMEIYRRCKLDNVNVNENDNENEDRAKLFVGARSAMFLPLDNVGLVIVDEEHEPSYKQQDPAPRYHARSAAIMLSHFAGAKVLLGSATPSIETYYNATTGKYGYVTLMERYAGLQLPRITMIDLKRQYHRKEMYGHFSDPLVDRIREELARGKQIILFQNRRGYAPYIQCTACGAVPKCTACDVSLTLHMRTRQLICHHCGYTTAIPDRCPECGGETKIHGFGTERLEEEVAGLFPEARVLRMDQDTTQKKAAYEDIIGRFSRHECDILIGTQMVSKGLHFDDVSLVAVLNADTMLHQPDFRSYERAYQMLEQVAGRAGRKGEQGEVIVQAMDPSHAVYEYVQRHDYESMAETQLSEREMFHFPPFHRIISVVIRHRDEARTEAAAMALRERLYGVFQQRCSPVIVPSVARVQNVYIREIRLRIEAGSNFSLARRMLREQIDYILAQPDYRAVTILPDVDR